MIYLLPSYNKHEKINKMLLKAAILSSVAIIFGWADTSVAESLDINLQLITRK